MWQGTSLKALKDFQIEFKGRETLSISTEDRCVVEDVIGYGHNVKKDIVNKAFRIMNSEMPDHFTILDKVEPCFYLKDFGYSEVDGNIITLKKNFKIKNAIILVTGQQFLHFRDKKEDNTFHDFFSIVSRAKVLRINEVEFLKVS